MRGKAFFSVLLAAVMTLQCATVSVVAADTIPETKDTAVETPAVVSAVFHLGGSAGDVALETAPGGTVTVPGEHILQSGMVLDGWRTGKYLGSVEFRPGEELTITEDAEFYPVWRTRETRKVTFVTETGSTVGTAREGAGVSTVPQAPKAPEGLRFLGWSNENGVIIRPESEPVWDNVTYTAVYAPDLTEEHAVYIQGYDDSTFRPGGTMTRAEAAVIIVRLMKQVPDAEPALTDVEEDAWYAQAAAVMTRLGALLTTGDGEFRPDEPITRAEFVYALARFFPVTAEEDRFADVPADYWARYAVNFAAEQGWLTGYEDGTFRPEASITRAEAVTVLNRVMARSGDEAAGEYHIARFPDLPVSHWAFTTVMEAATEHTANVTDDGETWTEYPEIRLAPGFHYEGGELMYVDPETGWYVADATVDGFQFDENGLYTSGNTELDGYVKAALAQITDASMSREEMLHAAFNYTRDSFTYLRRNYYQIGDTGWEMENALVMFQTGYGNCYCFASVFYYLSRQLGYDSTAISGVVGSNRSPHGWVEIDFNGVTNIFDPELEMAYRKKGVFIYDFYMMPYSRIPWAYVK